MYQLYFAVTQNNEMPYFNTAKFFFKDGASITIDRNTTEYCYDETLGILEMDWSELYEWNGEKENYDYDFELLEKAEKVELYIDDDAPEDYRCSTAKCYAESVEIPCIVKVED